MGEADRFSLRAIVHGRVQGVGFRAFAQGMARYYGLTGYARNLDDSSTVEVVAEGPKRDLDALVDWLCIGPAGSYVEHVDVSWEDATDVYEAFRFADLVLRGRQRLDDLSF
jgi:acylphosphatase